MVGVLTGDIWSRKGISLLWDIKSLSRFASADDILSLRYFLCCYEQEEWPEYLPTKDGKSLIIAGLDNLLNMMDPEEAQNWLEEVMYPALLSFQHEYEGECALIFWTPDLQHRLIYNMSDQIYYLQYREERLPLSLCLWNGAAKDARLIGKDNSVYRIIDKGSIGIYHPRIS